VALALLLVLLASLFLVGAMGYAYRSIGIGGSALFAVMAGSLLGGAVNIPLIVWRTDAFVVAEVVVFGVRYRLPVGRRPAHTERPPWPTSPARSGR
jgi:uncharacterized membrane protein